MGIEKVKKLVTNYMPNYITWQVIHIRNLKQALNRSLVVKSLHRVIKFNQKVQLKSGIDMNTELKKNDFEKDLF